MLRRPRGEGRGAVEIEAYYECAGLWARIDLGRSAGVFDTAGLPMPRILEDALVPFSTIQLTKS
ncbi:MAG: hypothetical protein DWI25_01590 [Planctomycetota bacterium]|nr:MAG: hypothetical protein DWI25_01590 [Planctomycetota bacterium]